MIHVECQACGRAFRARDELAGRRGKCPSCGEVLEIPSEEAPRPASPRRKSVSSRKHGAAARLKQRAGGRSKGRQTAVFVVAILLAAAGGFAAWRQGRQAAGPSPYTVGLDFMSEARYEEAIEQFQKVNASSNLYQDARDKLAEAQDRLAAEEALRQAKEAENLYQYIQRVETSYVERDGTGHTHPDYVANTRHLLSRVQEFLERFPDDSRTTELGQMMYRYSNVASLDTPLTEADVRAEMRFRLNAIAPQYDAVSRTIDEFQALSPEHAEAVRGMRAELQAHSLEFWDEIHAKLESDGSLAPGQENWNRVINMCRRYLDRVEGVAGITPAAEATSLLQSATAQQGG